MSAAPWVVDVLALRRPPSNEELLWMFQQLYAVMRLEDGFALRQLQCALTETLGHEYEGSERWSPEAGDEVYRNGKWEVK